MPQLRSAQQRMGAVRVLVNDDECSCKLYLCMVSEEFIPVHSLSTPHLSTRCMRLPLSCSRPGGPVITGHLA